MSNIEESFRQLEHAEREVVVALFKSIPKLHQLKIYKKKFNDQVRLATINSQRRPEGDLRLDIIAQYGLEHYADDALKSWAVEIDLSLKDLETISQVAERLEYSKILYQDHHREELLTD